MIFHENRLLADDFYKISYLIFSDDSHEVSYLFFRKIRKDVKIRQNLPSIGVVIGGLNFMFVYSPSS